MSTLRDNICWYNRFVANAKQPDVAVTPMDYNTVVCEMCRNNGEEECEHARHLRPPWYRPESAERKDGISTDETRAEMSGIAHSLGKPAYQKKLVKKMVGTRVDVDLEGVSVVCGIDPSGGGYSRMGLLVCTLMQGRLVILGWGVPSIVADVPSDDSYAPKVVDQFMSGFFAHYGDNFNMMVGVETNIPYHVGIVHNYIEDKPYASRLTWLREHPVKDPKVNEKTLGTPKNYQNTVWAKNMWHEHMDRGACIAKDPYIFLGGSSGDGYDFVFQELERQFTDYVEKPTKNGVSYTGKPQNDDLVAGAATQIALCTRIIETGSNKDKYPGLTFENTVKKRREELELGYDQTRPYSSL